MSRKRGQQDWRTQSMTMPVMPVDLAREAHIYRSMFDLAPVGIARISRDGLYIETNSRMCEIIGHEADALVGHDFSEFIHELDREEAIKAAKRLIAGEYPLYRIEKRRVRSDGTPVWVRVSCSMLDDSRLAVCEDISEQKQQQEHDDLLIHELNHRVKNSLALVQSISQQTLRSVTTLDQFRERFQSRLISLGSAHDVLTSHSWEGASLSEIIGVTLAPYVANGSTIITAGDPITLSAEAAVLMNMIFHELATNATKYGSLSATAGRLDIHWQYNDPTNPTTVRLVWQESGGPVVDAPEGRGFGSRVIEEGAARELGGKAEMCFKPSGLQCTITVPLSSKVRLGEPTSRNRPRPPRR